jgi:hypothetical protein
MTIYLWLRSVYSEHLSISSGSWFTVVLDFPLLLFHQFVISVITYNLLHPFIHIYAFIYIVNNAMDFPVGLLLFHYKERNLQCPIQTSLQLLHKHNNTIH